MISTIAKAFTVPEIRRKIAFTALMLALYRFGAHLTAPGISASAAKALSKSSAGSTGILSLLNLFSGGALTQMAVFALGIMPYITASIVLQILTVVVPSLEKLSKEGEIGQARITQYTRYLTVGLALGQSIGYVFLFHSLSSQAQPIIPVFDLQHIMLIVISLTAGTVLVMWMGELITQRGIGNGISLMIFASIVSRLPGAVQQWYDTNNQVFKVIAPFLVLAVVAGIVFVQEGQRRIPVQYAKRVIGRRMTSGQQTYLPLRVNMAGVIPVIFAASLMAFPPTIGQLVNTSWSRHFADFFSPSGWHYIFGEAVLIIVFTYFYTAVTFNPVDQADNLKKYGGFIPGVRPGRPTAEFLDRVLARLTFPGAIYLAFIAILPAIVYARSGVTFNFGGTSIIIVIGVALDTMKQLEAQLMMRNYEGFLRP
jgi:preprotein translocase subunit SecY